MIYLNKEIFVCDCDVIHEDVVARVHNQMPDSDNFYSLANFYKLLSDKTRVHILWALSCETMCVCDLAVLLDMTKSAISHQLKTLRLANLVKYEKKGREVYYSLSDKKVKALFKIYSKTKQTKNKKKKRQIKR